MIKQLIKEELKKYLSEDINSILKSKLKIEDIYALHLATINEYHKKYGISGYLDLTSNFENLVNLKLMTKLDNKTYLATKKAEEFMYDLALQNIKNLDNAMYLDTILKRKYPNTYKKVNNIFQSLYNRHEIEPKKYKKSSKLTFNDKNEILIALNKYQRNSNISHLRQLKKYSGHDKEFFDGEITLYRGLHFKNEEGYVNYFNKDENVRIGKFIIDKKGRNYSWSKNKNIAKNFAYGKTNWASDKKCFDNNSYGVILKHTFKPQDIMFDFEYMNNANPFFNGFEDFTEQEVIINPLKNAKYKIFKVLTNKCK